MNQAQKDFEKFLQEWTSTSFGRRSFLASVGLLLASCATPDKTRYREGDNSGQASEMTPDDERKMTQEVLPKMRQDYPPMQNAEVQTYVSSLGAKIVRANDLVGNPYNYSFTAVGVNMVNAFALPAGTVFVTAPLIAMAETEAELAGVVGHEVGHIKARHTAERMQVAKQSQSKAWLYAVGGGLAGAGLGYGLGRLLCPPKDSACMKKATEMGAAAGAAGGLLVQRYAFMANSREDEMEADRIGFKTSYTAGYSKDHVGQFYSKLLTMEQSRKGSMDPLMQSVADAMSTHPPSQERVNQMNQMAAEANGGKSSIVSSREFEKIKSICVQWVNSQPKKPA